VEAARSGDHRAFRAIVDHYDDRLRALAYRLLEDRDAMDDALQEAYLKAFRSMRSFRGESSLGTWLHRITYNACMDLLRRRKDTVPLFGSGTDDEPAPAERARPGSSGQDPLDAAVARTDLAAALATLPPEGRAAVQLVDAEGWTYEEAAKVLGVSPGTLASRVSRARTALRKALGTSS
jgi:RNA polymerase sigma-70 factor (ECF subfamily)